MLATQNPLEQEGTYPLPEAQLDRFFMQVDVGYPDRSSERAMLLATTGATDTETRVVMTPEALLETQRLGPPCPGRRKRRRGDPDPGPRRTARGKQTSTWCATMFRGGPGPPRQSGP